MTNSDLGSGGRSLSRKVCAASVRIQSGPSATWGLSLRADTSRFL